MLFLDPPEPGRKLFALEQIPEPLGIERVRAPRVAPGLRRMPGGLRRWLEHRWLRRLERLAGCQIEVIWLFENSRFFDLRFAQSRLKIYHQVDLNQSFYPHIAAQTADICFCTSELIRQQLASHSVKTYFVQHGMSSAASAPLSEDQQKLLQGGSLRLQRKSVFLISTGMCLSGSWCHPAVQFLIGAFDCKSDYYRRLRQVDNVTWWGKVDSAVIPVILQQMDILLLCYLQSCLEQVSNPHKLMEYLASGRIVVATYTKEYDQHRDLLAMSESGSNAGCGCLKVAVNWCLRLLNSWRQAFCGASFTPTA